MDLYTEGVATRTALPDEAVDLTASELHHRVLARLVSVLEFLVANRTLVLSDIFLRVRAEDGSEEQVSPDVALVPEARPGRRTVYRVPDEPVPTLTVEVLSPANHRSDGARVLADKRSLFGRIGVATHIEIDPDRGQVTTWLHNGTELEEGEPTTCCEHPALDGLRIETAPGVVRLFLPGGREFIDVPTEMARAEAERDRAEAERVRADTERARAERLARALREAGIDPTSI
ncbi:MAG TPA: Uma2 family endonuclease [Acidimicrobiales bacterium]|nr:Uma2 family endonuclease [Acidimicrobiales bacterium]